MTAAKSGRSTRASTPLRPCVHSRTYMYVYVVVPDLRAGHRRCCSAGFVVAVPSSCRTHVPDTRTGHTRRTHSPDTRPPVAASSRKSSRRSVVAQFRRRAVSRRSVVAPFRAVPSSRRFAPFLRRAVSSLRRTYAPDTRAVIARVPSSPFRRRAGHMHRTHAPDTLAGHTPTPLRRRHAVPSSRRSVVAPFRCRAVSSSRRTHALL